MVDRQREDEDAPPENNDIFGNEAPHHNLVNAVDVIVNHPEDPMREPGDRLPEQQASQEAKQQENIIKIKIILIPNLIQRLVTFLKSTNEDKNTKGIDLHKELMESGVTKLSDKQV
ncbi:hypothetical protein L6452_13860 [Arctium lappa]|uniref:Uncharacterized protein n=1 Tax=Arctium lappa TaxID=4217 RepID=A0ACB9CJD4_ARCLA|nr:hypothetical protein L6452_13860 [Arctium lappa]